MYGIRLLGIPLGSSPISPLSCAPIGLKYLSNTIDKSGFAFETSVNICSFISFVHPYGFVHDVGIFSFNGTCLGIPYTVAEELKTKSLTSYFFITSNKVSVLSILFL